MTMQVPWYDDIVNYLASGIMPSELTYQQKRKLRTYAIFYIWDDPLLFRRGVHQIIRRCVPEAEQAEILDKFQASPYGGQFVGDRTTHKILYSDSISQLYLETVLKGSRIMIDVREWAI